MPLPSERVIESPPSRPGKLFDFVRYKNKMAKKKAEIDENVDLMDRKDLLVKLLELTTKEDINVGGLRTVVKHAIEVLTRKK